MMKLPFPSGRVAIWALAAAAAVSVARLAAAPETRAAAPDFTAETIDGKKIHLADYKGKSAVLLNFYANY